MDESGYASLLAQVFPVVILAVIVEARSLHEVWQKAFAERRPSVATGRRKPEGGQKSSFWLRSSGSNMMLNVFGHLLVFNALVIFEAAAVAVASGKRYRLAEFILHPAIAVITITAAFVLVAVLWGVTIVRGYFDAGVLSDNQRVGFQTVLRLMALLTVVAVGCLLFVR